MEPAAAVHSLPMTRSSDDLPQPEGPDMRQPWPGSIWSGMRCGVRWRDWGGGGGRVLQL